MRSGLKAVFVIFLSSLISVAQTPTRKQSSNPDIQKFLSAAETRLNDLNVKTNRTGWVQQTYITDDTEAINASAPSTPLPMKSCWPRYRSLRRKPGSSRASP